MGVAAACTPQPPAAESWTFRANSVTVHSSQDEVRDPVFGACISLFGCSDEPYSLNIGFRVKIGEEKSADVQVSNNRTDAPEGVGEGQTVTLVGNQQNAITWNNITPLDVLDLSTNKLEIVGVYSWASEEDLVGNGVAADSLASALENALNDTLAKGTLPGSTSEILNMVFNNILNVLGIAVQNIPLFGLGDDVLGGALYLGIGAKGSLADIINSSPMPPITFNSPLTLPPDVVGGGIFTFKDPSTFTQTFSGAGGSHTYNFGVSKN